MMLTFLKFFTLLSIFSLSTVHGATSLNAFAKRTLARHNFYREQYGAEPLKWSPALAKTAKKWAERCVFQHGGGVAGGYGENIAAGYTDVKAVVDDWVNGINESGSYNPSNPTASHFTQVVWKNTKKVGCAKVHCDSLAVFDGSPGNLYVCEYDPPGNVFPADNFKKNVGTKEN
ncbi:PR-1-like protein [Atractiella rhizophila]|nr:PR-1-like protein [Atractiella rhizophila]KAH8922777.1 PR-1-like protein [Atractiella rhizophila]